MHVLNLIRWKNLAIIALVQILIKYALFPSFEIDGTLSPFGFCLLVLSTLCLAAAGYIINDIYDVETDLVNTPDRVIIDKHISEKTANRLFFGLNIIGICLGLYLSNVVGKNAFFPIFVIISALLYTYASYLKQLTLIGNITVAFIIAMSLIIVGIFELLPIMTTQNRSFLGTMFGILVDYAIFAFVINLIREIVKDCEDIDGDYKADMKTLPIVLGLSRASKIAFLITIGLIVGVIFYLGTYLYIHIEALIYFLILIIAPLIYIAIKLFTAESKIHFRHISNMLKYIMILGMLSMLLYQYIL